MGASWRTHLPGLGNRTCLRENLDRLLDTETRTRNGNQTVAVLFVGLDRFKAINDGLGHEIGDKVLMEVSRRIKAACQRGEICCRLGKDEFVAILQGDMAENAEQAAKTILTSIRAPLQLGSRFYSFQAAPA